MQKHVRQLNSHNIIPRWRDPTIFGLYHSTRKIDFLVVKKLASTLVAFSHRTHTEPTVRTQKTKHSFLLLGALYLLGL